MRTYVLKRALIMIPTLLGISMVVWIIVTAAPGDPGQAEMGEAQTQRGRGVGQSRRIFRAQFNLDKPLFWNDYPSLTPEEVLRTVKAVVDRQKPLGERNEAQDSLEDWGYYAVPALIGALDLAESPAERALVIVRLRRNAKRVSPASLGKELTKEDRIRNREILRENLDIDERLSLDGEDASPDVVEEKARLWKQWFEERKERWSWAGWAKLKLHLFDTKFAKFWGNVVRLDLGISHVHRKPVLALIGERIRVSLALMVTSLILAYVLSIPLGIWSAVRHRSPGEQILSTFLFMLYSLPSFFTATLLLHYMGIGQPWRIIPVQGFESEDTFGMTTWQHVKDILHHTLAPVFCLTYVSLAALSRYAKTGLLNVIRSDYVRTARAKGLSETLVILKHAVRNGIIPIITLLGTTLPVVVGGSIIIETVFNIPGIGLLMWDSINQRDYNVVIGLSTIVAVLTMLGILVADILYAVVDPRISFE